MFNAFKFISLCFCVSILSLDLHAWNDYNVYNQNRAGYDYQARPPYNNVYPQPQTTTWWTLLDRLPYEEGEQAVFEGIIKDMIVTLGQQPQDPNTVCWVNGYNCLSNYTRIVDDALGRLNTSVDPAYRRNISMRLNHIKQSIQNLIQKDTLPFATYTLSILSTPALEALKRGKRIPLLSEDDIRKSIPGDLSNVDLELLLYEYAEDFEHNTPQGLSESIRAFQQKQNRWINLLSQGFDKQSLLNQVRKILNIIAHKRYNTTIIAHLLTLLPADEQGYPLQQNAHDESVSEWTAYRQDIDKAERQYRSFNFGAERQKEKLSQAYKDIYSILYNWKGACPSRKACLDTMQGIIRRYSATLPQQHPFKQQEESWMRKLTQYAQDNDTFDYAEALYNRIPKEWQTLYEKEKLPDISRLNDQRIQNAITSKQLSSGHIMIMMLQKASEMEQNNTGRRMNFDQVTTQFQSEMDKIISRFERVALRINTQSEAEIDTLRSLLSNVLQDAQRHNPKRTVLDFIYKSIPLENMTDFDAKTGTFLAVTDIKNFKDAGQRYGAQRYIPDTPPHGGAPKTFAEQHTNASTTQKAYNTSLFRDKEPEKKTTTPQKSPPQSPQQKKSKKTKDKIKDIGEKVTSNIFGQFEGFLNRALGGLFK